MAFTHILATNWNGGGVSLSRSSSYSASAEQNIDEAIPDSSTDLEVALVLDVSEIKSIYMVSDQALTVETNLVSGTDTIVLVADVPYIWYTGSYYTNLLATDVTKLFLTNASGSTANFKLRCVVDATP